MDQMTSVFNSWNALRYKGGTIYTLAGKYEANNQILRQRCSWKFPPSSKQQVPDLQDPQELTNELSSWEDDGLSNNLKAVKLTNKTLKLV